MTFKELKDKLKKEKEAKEGFAILSIALSVIVLFSAVMLVSFYKEKNIWRDAAMEELKPKPVAVESVCIPPNKSILEQALKEAEQERDLVKIRLETLQYNMQMKAMYKNSD